MKKIVFSLILILSGISVYSQDFEPSFTFGINAGMDHNLNAYQFQKMTNPAIYEYYGKADQYNIGVDFAFAVTKKLRPRVEFRYVNCSYGVRWNDPAYNFVKTTWNVNNFDFNLHLDYLLFTSKKLDIYGSPGLKFEFYTGDFMRTTQKNGSSSTDRFNILESAFPTSIAGGAFAMIFKYNITKHIGFTVTPEYTLFFRDYVSSNNKAYQRFSANAGFEFNF